MSRSKANKLLDLCRSGAMEPMDVLENVLTNYMSSDDADDFAETEYDISEDDSDVEDEIDEDTLNFRNLIKSRLQHCSKWKSTNADVVFTKVN